MTDRDSLFQLQNSMQSSKYDRFLQGFFGFSCLVAALFLFFFSSALSPNYAGVTQFNVPCQTIVVAATALLFPLLRITSNYLDTASGQKVLHIFSLVGLIVGSLGLLFPFLSIPCAIFFACGIVSASALWAAYFMQFNYTLLALLTGSAFTLGTIIAAAVSAAHLDCKILAFACCGFMLASWIFLKFCSNVEEFTGRNSTQNYSKQARTAKIDRWTYSFIGFNTGIALSLMFSCFEDINFILPDVLKLDSILRIALLFTPIICASILILAFRTNRSHIIEKYSKDFFASIIALSVLLLITKIQVCMVVGFFILLFSVFLQIIIVVNASIGFIQVQMLSPTWYLAEEAFVSGGVAVGILFVFLFNLISTSLPNQQLPLFFLLAINSFLQVPINQGSFPIQTQDSSTKKDRSVSLKDTTPIKADKNEESQQEQDYTLLPSVFLNANKEANGSGGGIWRTKVNCCCQQYKLTPRQREVFVLLARGRDLKCIEERLMISHATAKSHIYNIYLKLDVHSRQELIDLVENTPLNDEKSENESTESG